MSNQCTKIKNEQWEKRQKFLIFLKLSNQWRCVEVGVNKFIADFNANGNEFLCAPILIKFTFDYDTTKNASETYLNFLLNEPFNFIQILRQTIFVVLNTFLAENNIQSVNIAQIHTTYQILGLPQKDEFKFQPIIHPIRTGIANFLCILSGYGEERKNIRQSVWYCPSECLANKITGKVSKAPKCTQCSANMMEYTKHRYMSDYMMISVLPPESVETPRQLGKTYRSVAVKLTDDLTHIVLRLGHKYLITGIYDGHNQFFLAFNIIKVKN